MSETYPGQMLPELQEKTTVDSNDLFYMVSSNASKKIKGSNLKDQMKPSDYTGATSSTNGANGLVPQPTTSDVDRFLKGDGTWGDISYAVGEASGSIATFSDGSPLPMRSLKAYIEPVQDLHGYDSPWVGGAGKNKCNATVRASVTQNGITSEVKEDNLIVASGTSTGNGDIGIVLANDISVSANSNYTVSIGGSNSGNILLFFRDTDGNYYGPIYRETGVYVYKYTFASAISIHEILFRATSGTTININGNIQIELGSTATSYSPYSNKCPISGWDECNVARAGKNLCKSTLHGYVSSSDDLIVIDNDTESAIFYAHEGQTYTISSSATMSKSRVALVETDNIVNYTPILQREILSDNVNTWTATWTGWTVWYKCSSRQTAFDNSVQVELGSTATSYETYADNTYTIDLDGTRYGGKVDLVSGVMTVDRAIKTVADCYWYGSNGFFYAGTVMNEIVHGDGRYDHCISDVYATKNVAQSSSLVNGEMSVDASGYLQLKDERYSSTSDFKTAMGTSQLVYELATPLTIQLTPTQVKSLLGVNNVWADTGDVDVHYVRDLTITIDDILSRLEALEG